ncbi:hypothetical protein [Dermabacter hominis]|uniref:hypothetical protein n=1 Tax=Dermabacter hominis TaxID=36740 RepID=UPI0021A5CC03|nr:hypothetical protein [Dermabacter hominis]MCT1807733.1 hypothetical protein [Dermabacter hominis]
MKVAGLESSVSQAQYRADTAYETARQVQTSSEAWFTELTDADSSLASSLSMMASDLNLRVRPGEIISQINISPETILIDGKRIHITGQTNIDNATITTRLMNGLPTFYAGEESTAWGIETLGGGDHPGLDKAHIRIFTHFLCHPPQRALIRQPSIVVEKNRNSSSTSGTPALRPVGIPTFSGSGMVGKRLWAVALKWNRPQ